MCGGINRLHSLPDPIKVNRQVDGNAGYSSDEDMSDDQPSIALLQSSVFASSMMQKHVNKLLQPHFNSVLYSMCEKSKKLRRIKVSRQVDGTAGDTSDEDGSDISDDQ
jgi:hypothetical protein